MFRIGSQPAPQPAQAAGATPAQQAPAPNSLQGLLAALEKAIQQLMQQQGGAHAGGGDRMEPAPHAPAHRHHHHRHHQRRSGERPAPTTPPSKGPVVIAGPIGGPVVKLPENPEGGGVPKGGQAYGYDEGPKKGLAGGTVGT